MRATIVFLFALFSLGLAAQPSLPYSINNGILPADGDSIQAVTPYIDTTNQFDNSGFLPGTIVPDFTLFDTAGAPGQLSVILADSVPVLLVAVSHTCPVSRHSLEFVLPDIYTLYGTQINIVCIYEIEAHPIGPDVSPYSGTVWVTWPNQQDSILYPQPDTYGERKDRAKDFLALSTIPLRLLLDGPGNEYWSAFGPAPNNAYLLAPNGMVYAKYGWLDYSETQIMDDIPVLLATVGMTENSAPEMISIFPNPSSGNAKLVVESAPGGETVYGFRIVDAAGRLVAAENNVTAPTELGKYSLDAGMYMIVVETASGKTRVLPYIRM